MRADLARQCVIVAVLSCLSDIVATAHVRSVAAGQLALAAATVLLMQLAGFTFQTWFIEAKHTGRRLALALAAGAGAAAGTTFVLLFC